MTNPECPICLNAIEGTDCCTTECGHNFHSSCIFKNFTNSVSCPMCRKELVEVPKEEDEEDSEWEIDTLLDSEISNSDNEDEDEDDDEEDDKRKLSIRQIQEAITKQGYNETDFISFIISDYFDYKVKVSKTIDDRSSKMLDIIEKMCNGEIAVDHRDNRSYAQVVNNIVRIEEPGRGPAPRYYE